MAIYMKFGSDIKGAVTTDGWKEWIEIDSFQWGVGRGIGSATGGSESREASNPSISELVVTKRMDKSSPKLFEDAVGGDMSTEVVIHFTTTTKNTVVSYLELEFTNVGLSGFSMSSGGDKPTESLSLNFTKVSLKFTPKAADLSGTPTTVGYDLTLMSTT